VCSRGVVGSYVLVGFFRKGPPPLETLLPPFIVLRGRAGYSRDSRAEKGGKKEKKGGYGEKQTGAPGSSSSFPSLAWAPHFWRRSFKVSASVHRFTESNVLRCPLWLMIVIKNNS
jgi:hypothetical protein